jgi:hypothetical protein
MESKVSYGNLQETDYIEFTVYKRDVIGLDCQSQQIKPENINDAWPFEQCFLDTCNLLVVSIYENQLGLVIKLEQWEIQEIFLHSYSTPKWSVYLSPMWN